MCRIRRCGSMPVALSRSFFDESADKTAVIPVLCRRRIRRYLCRCSWNNRHRFLQCLYNLGYRSKYFHSRRGMFWFRCRLSTLRCRSVHCRRRNRPDRPTAARAAPPAETTRRAPGRRAAWPPRKVESTPPAPPSAGAFFNIRRPPGPNG